MAYTPYTYQPRGNPLQLGQQGYQPQRVQQQSMGGYNPQARTQGNTGGQQYNLPTNNGNNSSYNPYGNGPQQAQGAVMGGQGQGGGGMLPYNPSAGNPPIPNPTAQQTTFSGNYGAQMPAMNLQVPQWQTPTYTPTAPGTAPNSGQFNYYPGLDPRTLETAGEREAKLQAVQASLPIAQFNQNNYQWQQEYNQANQRYWDATGWQRQGDQFNMSLAAQQQAQAQWQAQQAANQWQSEFGRQTGLDTWNQQFSQRQFGLQEWQTQEQLRQSQQGQQQQFMLGQGQLSQQAAELAQLRAYQTGQLGLGQQTQADTARYQQGQLTQQANELNQLRNYQTGQLQLGQGQLQLGQQTQADTARYQQGQLGIAQQQNAIDQMYKSGQLSLGQAQQALAELTQTQTYGLQQQQFTAQQAELARRFGLDTQTQTSLEQYRNAQLAQEAALQREQMAAQQRIATMQQFGRNQTPNTRWIRAS